MKIITLNIEGHRHLAERVIPFLEKEQPDVVCLQEVFRVDLPRLVEVIGGAVTFAPMSRVVTPNPHVTDLLGELGVGIISRLPVADEGIGYYFKREAADEMGRAPLPEFFSDEDPNSVDRVLVWMSLEVPGSDQAPVTVATTHFTWSPQGQVTQLQRENFNSMLELTTTLPPHLLMGDFNAPRGREIFDSLSQRYIDHIPAEISTTIDNTWHKATEDIQFVVDGFFGHPRYRVADVRVVAGLSDHMAIVAEVSLR